MIVAACVLTYLIEVAVGVQDAAVAGGLVPFAVADGEVWRLITSAFLHAGLLHLGFNMLVLVMLGPALEAALGHAWFAVLYLLSALGGAAASYLFSAPVSVSVGASGAIFGLMGAIVVAGRRLRFDVTQVLVLIAINLVFGFLAGSVIDWRAHLGGLATGAVVAAVLVHAPRRNRIVVQAVGCLAIALVLAGLVGMRTAQLRGPSLAAEPSATPAQGSPSAAFSRALLVSLVDQGTVPGF